ncbi:hypothetical protein [Phytopseudomonas punonensis]|uniref:Etoposide-induced protein 2.4 (EI24) n=1 Tax=Phytopseudomonas punonensis TaxID=1220495 RepID=A0A1M7L1Y8_9GAMM|nr:hypothetical protein [Pseudomonas punonensis]SHM71356.1 hypothetical protein SAMN05216288_4177 [Pseudomonas punonensis]
MSLKSRCQSVASAFGEAFTCLALAFRSSLQLGVLTRSCGLCFLAFALWTWLFYTQFEVIAQAAGLLSLFIVMGAAILGFVPSIGGAGAASVSGMASIAPALGILVVYAGLLTLLMIGTLYIGLIVLSIRLALRWVLMGSLRERALRHYPPLAQRQAQPAQRLTGARYHLGPWLGLSIGSLLCLLIPLLNGVLLLLLLAYLNVRFLVPAALSGLANGSEQLQAVHQQRGAMTAFGLLILLIAPIPLINLLLPALLGAGSCHLAYRGLQRAGLAAGVAEAPQVSLPPP